MKKLTKQGLSDLAKTMPIVLKDELSMCVGCGDGSIKDPFTFFEFKNLVLNREFGGGYVDMNGIPKYHKAGVVFTESDFINMQSGMLDDAYGNGGAVTGSIAGITGGVLSLLNTITGMCSIKDHVLDLMNYHNGYKDLKSYFEQNPDGNLYYVKEIFQSNKGAKVVVTTYYDGSNVLTKITDNE